jgi:hypothetical protein
MKLSATKKYLVDGVTYDTKAEATKAMSMKILNESIPKGTSFVIENASEIIRALYSVTKK